MHRAAQRRGAAEAERAQLSMYRKPKRVRQRCSVERLPRRHRLRRDPASRLRQHRFKRPAPPMAFQPECPLFMYLASKPASRSLLAVLQPT